MKNEAPEEST